MKLFIKKILVFVLGIILMLLCLDLFVFPNNNNTYNYKASLLEDMKVDVIVSGNSHLAFGVLTDSIKSYHAINIATKGRNLSTDIDLLTNRIEKRPNLKAVLIPISYYSLFYETKKSDEMEKRLYYRFFNIKKYDQNFIKNSLIINEPFRELMNDSFFLSFLKGRKVSKKGWRANDNEFIKDPEIKKKIANLETKLDESKIIKNNVNRLKEFNKKCSANNVKLILVLPPYSEYYYSLTEHKYNNLINKILSEELSEIEIIDAYKFMPVAKDYYENSDHLNVKGAKLFTQKLDSILKIRL